MQRLVTASALRNLTRKCTAINGLATKASFNTPMKLTSAMNMNIYRTFSTTPTTTTTEKAEKNEKNEKEQDNAEDEIPPAEGWKKYLIYAGDLTIGTFLGISMYYAVKYLLDFPVPLQNVFEYCKTSPFLEEHVGFPLSRSLLWFGVVKDDYYRIEMTVSGPKGSANVHAMGFLTSRRDEAPQWQIYRCDAALEKFDYRLTDLLPADPRDNVAPYVPSPDDPSAQHFAAPPAAATPAAAQ